VGSVKIEVMPWITTQCGYNSPGNLIIEEEIEDGETLGSVIKRARVARRPLAECIVDPATQNVHGYISIIFNDHLISQLSAKHVRLKSGDTVRLLPTIEGG